MLDVLQLNLWEMNWSSSMAGVLTEAGPLLRPGSQFAGRGTTGPSAPIWRVRLHMWLVILLWEHLL